MFVNQIVDDEKILSWAANESAETNKYYLDLVICKKIISQQFFSV